MTATYSIRAKLRPGDIGYITYLHGILHAREFGWDHRFETYVAVPLAEVAQAGRCDERIWIVEAANKVCGSIALVRRSSDVAQLRWFLLDPALRGKGVGKQLLELLLEFAREQHYRSIELWTITGLPAAAGLYRRYGFELVEEKSSQPWGSRVTEQKYQLDL
jgi:GNAT superfamily N-acetyltransferase